MPRQRNPARAVFPTAVILLTAAFLPASFSPAARVGSAQQNAGATAAEPPRTLYVTVFTERGHYIGDLPPGAFGVYDGEREVPVVSSSHADVPVTLGIVFDASSSMRATRGVNSKEKVSQALQILLRAGKGADETFLVAFNDRPQLILRDTSDTAAVLSALDRLTAVKAVGQTALYDALYLALDHASNGRHQKRALVVLTDGFDTVSEFSRADVKRALREGDVAVYVVNFVFYDGQRSSRDLQDIEEFAELSGGKAFFPHNERELEYSMTRIAQELRNQYALGIVPPPSSRKDGWHEIKIKMARGRDEKGKAVKLFARTRKGFYGPTAAKK